MTATAIDATTLAVQTLLTAGLPGLAIQHPDVAFTPPANDLWLRYDVLWGRGVVWTMAPTASNNITGVVHLRLYAPNQTGSGALDRLADSVRALLNRVAVPTDNGQDIRFMAPSGPARQPNEPIDGDLWSVKVVTAPFTIEERD